MGFFNKYKNSIFSGAIIIGIASFVSRILGLVRDRLFAENFGASEMLDAYYAAFRIPDLIFNLLILGALSSAFIPVFIEHLNKNKKEAYKITSTVLNLSTLIMVAICSILFAFIPKLVFLIAPGFSEELKETAATLTRIMLISPIFFGISNIFSGILNSFKRFVAYSLAPIFYNLGIILGAVFFVPEYGIYGLAIGVAIGSFLHMMVQIPSVYATGFKYSLGINIFHRGVLKIGKLMAPRTLGLAVGQINLWVITVIASMQGEGGISTFNFANNIQYIPIGIFGISFAVSSFPFLAESYAKNRIKHFKDQFSGTFCKILFFVVPLSVLMLVERAQIVRLVLGSGKFDWQDTYYTSQSLGLFAIGIFAQALIPLVAKTFYSIQDTKTPVIISIVTVVTNIILSFALVNTLGILGLALSFSISSFINIILLISFLRLKIGDLNDNKIFICSVKIVAASFISGFVAYMTLNILAPLVDMQTYLGVLIQACGATTISILFYLAFSYLFKLEELSVILKNITFKK